MIKSFLKHIVAWLKPPDRWEAINQYTTDQIFHHTPDFEEQLNTTARAIARGSRARGMVSRGFTPDAHREN